MKIIYFSLLILFFVLLLVSPVIFAEPNTDLKILLYSEDKEDTATHLKLHASDEITSNKRIIYSIIITASVPSPLGPGNVIDQGLVTLVIPETTEVDYQNIKVYGAPTPDSNKYVEYQAESRSTKELFDILGLIISKIPVLGLVMDLAPIYQVRPGDYGEFIDLNHYDVVKINWETPRLKYWQKVQIDIPVHLSDDAEIGLYAYWQSRASSSDGTGPTYARDNVVDVGFDMSEKQLEEEVVLRVEKLTWDKTFGGSESDWASSLIQTTDGGYALAGRTESYGAGDSDLWIIKLDNRGNKLWDKTYGGSEYDRASSLIQTTDGGYVLAGRTESYGAGDSDVWVIKLDSRGNKIWDKTFGGDDYDSASSLIQTTDGGYAVAGYTFSYGAGKNDAWVIKLDSRGNKIWDKTFGGDDYDSASSLIQTTDGGYAVAGRTESYGAGDEDVWVIKMDSRGNKLWDKTFGGSKYDLAESLIQTTAGGYVVAGFTDSYVAGDADFWLIKLDSRGNKLWDKTFSGGRYDRAYSLISTDEGGYAVAGHTCSYGTGKYDAWVIKLDSRGNKLWDKTYGGSDNDWIFSLNQTTDGGYVLAGRTESYGAGNNDVWVIKLDEKGDLKSTPEKETIYEKSESKLIKKGSLKLVITTSLTSIFSSAHRDLIVTIDGPIHQSQTFDDIGTATPVSVYFNNIPEGHYRLTARYGSDQITKELEVSGDIYGFSLVFY